jgi:hypothetical protein
VTTQAGLVEGGHEADVDTTGSAIRCNTGQAGEEKAA